MRFAKTIPFAWKPDVWYTMKFQSENKDGKAILRGKVWPRGEAEPAEWTIEAADETPNVIGSPGTVRECHRRGSVYRQRESECELNY